MFRKSVLLVTLIIIVIIITLVKKISHEIKMADRSNATEVSCTLLKKSYSESTIEHRAAPIVGVGTSGNVVVGVGLSTSGNGEQFTTIFDCGANGNLVSNKKIIFTKSKNKNTLLVNFIQGDYRILDVIRAR